MKRVIVTGATGFIGRGVLPLLQERGYEVHALGRSAADGSDITSHALDLLAPERVQAVVAAIGASHLLHLAWYAKPGLYWTSPCNLNWVAASLNLMRCFVEAGGRRAVVAGTCAEYEWGESRLYETRSRCAPKTLYGAAKDGLRQVLEAYSQHADFSFAWGRIFYLYGPAEKSNRLVSDAIRQLLAGERFPTSAGYQKRDFLHVADVAEAFVALLGSDVRGVVNIGSGQAVPVRTILELIATEIGRADLIAFGEIPLPPGEPPVIEADTTRLNEEIAFSPRFSLEHGLKQTVDWWRDKLG